MKFSSIMIIAVLGLVLMANGAAADKFVFTTGPQTLNAGAMSSQITVQRQTDSGVAITSGAETKIQLTSSSSFGRFYSNSNGNNIITEFTISNGGSTYSFYYNDTTVGTPTITVSKASWTSGNTQFKINRVYTHSHTINGAIINDGSQPSDTVTTSPGGNFNYGFMKFTWKQVTASVPNCIGIIQTIPETSVTDNCNFYTHSSTDTDGSVTAAEYDGVEHQNSIATFTVKKAPEFGKIGPAISIFLVGAFYVYFRKQAFKK
jgi:hypothetical protein